MGLLRTLSFGKDRKTGGSARAGNAAEPLPGPAPAAAEPAPSKGRRITRSLSFGSKERSRPPAPAPAAAPTRLTAAEFAAASPRDAIASSEPQPSRGKPLQKRSNSFSRGGRAGTPPVPEPQPPSPPINGPSRAEQIELKQAIAASACALALGPPPIPVPHPSAPPPVGVWAVGRRTRAPRAPVALHPRRAPPPHARARAAAAVSRVARAALALRLICIYGLPARRRNVTWR
jgi:hypothetical protein